MENLKLLPLSVEWNLAGVVAWYMFEDQEFSNELTGQQDSAAYLGVLSLHPITEKPPAMTFQIAIRQVMEQLRKGTLECRCITDVGGQRELISEGSWVGRKFSFDPDIAHDITNHRVTRDAWRQMIFYNAPDLLKGSAAVKHDKITQNDVRKLTTQKQYELWNKVYRQLKRNHPGKGDSWIAKEIAKDPEVSNGRSVDTIRKNMK